MSFRVNNNVSAFNAHRQLQSNHTDLSSSLERLSSGIKINRASDGPAAFAISEHLRSQVAGVSQAISNSETAVSILQTTEANMGEITTLLNGIRQIVIHSLNAGANDEHALMADQVEIENSLSTIEEIAGKAQFGSKKLLDGSNGVSGTTTGEGLAFVNATMKTRDSREDGFEVYVLSPATQSKAEGTVSLNDDIIKSGETLTAIEDGKMASYTTSHDDTVATAVQNFKNAISAQGLALHVDNDDGLLSIHHKQFGSKPTFQVSSSTAGVLSKEADQIELSEAGKDIRGTINGETATGVGQVLTGIEGASCIDGLKVRYDGVNSEDCRDDDCTIYDITADENGGDPLEEFPEEGKAVGRVFVAQNSMRFQVGGNRAQSVGISLRDMKPTGFATHIDNDSGFRSLADINITDLQKAQDSLELVDVAIYQIAEERGRLGAFQKNSLETNLSNLRVANENLISSESVIRDTDMAKEMAVFTKNQIKTESSAAMLAHSNQRSENVLQLLQ